MEYEFTITLSGQGDTLESAWQDATEAFAADAGEPINYKRVWHKDDPHGVACASRLTSSAECTCGKADYIASSDHPSDIEILNRIEDFLVNNYDSELSPNAETRTLLDHIIELLEKR